MSVKYHLFLSCENISVKNEKIEKFLNKIIEQDPQASSGNIKIKCMCRHDDNINVLKNNLDHLEKSTIYIVNTHEELDSINYWEIGYAMGKGIDIVGYTDGESKKNIPGNIENLIYIPENIEMFIDKIEDIIDNLKPKQEIFARDWIEQSKPAEKEIEGGI